VVIALFLMWFPGLSVVTQATTLSVGDISIIGFNSDDSDCFTFVPWVRLDAGTQISFTDGGYDARNGTYRPTEGWITWTAPETGVDAGTVVISYDLTGLSTSGDQIFAFNNNSVIFGLQFNNVAAYTPGWDTYIPDGVDLGTNRSYLPSELNVSGGNIAVYEMDNGEYRGLKTGLGPSEYKLLITSNYFNWYLDDNKFTLDTTGF